MAEGFVRLSRENIDLKAQVASLEELVSSLRTEVQKTHVHIHNVVGGSGATGSGTPTPRGVTRTGSNNKATTESESNDDKTEIQKLKDEQKALKLKIHEAELREKDLIVALRVSDMASVISHRTLPEEVLVAMLRIQNSWKNARLPEDLAADKSHQVVCSLPVDATGTTATIMNEAGEYPNSDALLQQISEKDTEIGNLYVSLQELETARDTFNEQLEAEKVARAEAEEHWRESHASATAYYEESEQLKAQLQSLQQELDAARQQSGGHKDPEGNFSPSISQSMSPSSPATIPSKYENLITARVEEETFLMREDHENEITTLKEKLKANEDKVKLLNLELGKSQLEIRKLKNGSNQSVASPKPESKSEPSEEWDSDVHNPPVLPQQSGTPTPISSVSRRLELADAKKTTNVSVDYQQQLAAAQAAKEIANRVKEEALFEVKELTRKLHRLEAQLAQLLAQKDNGMKPSFAQSETGSPSANWAEQLMKSKDEQIVSYQRRVAEAEAENKFSQQRLMEVQQAAAKDKHQSDQTKSELESKIKSLEKKLLVINTNGALTSPIRGSNNTAPLSPTNSLSDVILMSKLSTSTGSGSATSVNKINNNVGASFIEDSTKSFKERILMKRLLLQQQQQKQQKSTDNAAASLAPSATVTIAGSSHKQWNPSAAVQSSGTVTTMTHDETVQCVDNASDKAEVIAQRLQRALRAKLLGNEGVSRPSAAEPSAAAAEVITSAATSDFLSELIADALMDYEVKLSHLKNEILSYQTIIAVKDADAEEERRNATRLLNDEFENFRVAKMIQEEEQAAKRAQVASSPSRAQRRDLTEDELHQHYQRQFGGK